MDFNFNDLFSSSEKLFTLLFIFVSTIWFIICILVYHFIIYNLRKNRSSLNKLDNFDYNTLSLDLYHKDYSKIKVFYQECIKDDYKLFESLLKLAEISLYENKYETSIGYLLKTLNNHSIYNNDKIKIFNLLSKCYYNLYLYDKSYVYAEKTINLNPNNTEALYNLIKYYERNKDWKNVILYYERYSNNSEVFNRSLKSYYYYKLGEYLIDKKDTLKGLKNLDRALSIDFTCFPALWLKSENLLAENNITESLQCYKELYLNFPIAIMLTGRINYFIEKLQQPDQIIESLFRSLIIKYPDFIPFKIKYWEISSKNIPECNCADDFKLLFNQSNNVKDRIFLVKYYNDVFGTTSLDFIENISSETVNSFNFKFYCEKCNCKSQDFFWQCNSCKELYTVSYDYFNTDNF